MKKMKMKNKKASQQPQPALVAPGAATTAFTTIFITLPLFVGTTTYWQYAVALASPPSISQPLPSK